MWNKLRKEIHIFITKSLEAVMNKITSDLVLFSNVFSKPVNDRRTGHCLSVYRFGPYCAIFYVFFFKHKIFHECPKLIHICHIGNIWVSYMPDAEFFKTHLYILFIAY